MKLVNFGKLSKVSKLSLGGAGLGQVWGSTTRKESISTLLQALDDGINLLDMAPTYGNNEAELVLLSVPVKSFEGVLSNILPFISTSIPKGIFFANAGFSIRADMKNKDITSLKKRIKPPAVLIEKK